MHVTPSPFLSSRLTHQPWSLSPHDEDIEAQETEISQALTMMSVLERSSGFKLFQVPFYLFIFYLFLFRGKGGRK